MDQNQLLKLGELTSYVSLLSPLPTFLMCGKSIADQNKMIDTLQFSFLLLLFVISNIWLSYFEHRKESTITLVVMNQARTVATSVYIVLYLIIKARSKSQEIKTYVFQTVFIVFFVVTCTKSLAQQYLLPVALLFEMVNNLIQFGQIPNILRDKSIDQINLPVAVCCTIDAAVWLIYSVVNNDLPFTILNGSGILAGFLQLYLYEWAIGRVKDDHWSILILHQVFGRFSQQKRRPSFEVVQIPE